MVVTDSEELAERLRSLRNHGAIREGNRISFLAPGLNYRMTEVQAALGLCQMGKLHDLTRRREEIASYYRSLLSDLPVSFPLAPPGYSHTYQSLVLLLHPPMERDRVIRRLWEMGVESTIGTYAIHREPYYRKKYGYREGDLPNSFSAFERSLAIPIHPGMSDGDVERVSHALRRVMP